jgi:hypothetical protein
MFCIPFSLHRLTWLTAGVKISDVIQRPGAVHPLMLTGPTYPPSPAGANCRSLAATAESLPITPTARAAALLWDFFQAPVRSARAGSDPPSIVKVVNGELQPVAEDACRPQA